MLALSQASPPRRQGPKRATCLASLKRHSSDGDGLVIASEASHEALRHTHWLCRRAAALKHITRDETAWCFRIPTWDEKVNSVLLW